MKKNKKRSFLWNTAVDVLSFDFALEFLILSELSTLSFVVFVVLGENFLTITIFWQHEGRLWGNSPSLSASASFLPPHHNITGCRIVDVLPLCLWFSYTLWAIKSVALYFCPYLHQLLINFQNSFTGTLCRQFANSAFLVCELAAGTMT